MGVGVGVVVGGVGGGGAGPRQGGPEQFVGQAGHGYPTALPFPVKGTDDVVGQPGDMISLRPV